MKAGEAALLRRKIESTSSEYEKRLQREREAHSHAFNQQKTQLDLTIKEKRQIEDNNRFLEHDLRQAHAAAVSRKTNAAAKETSGGPKSFDTAGTPKKSRQSLPFRDGFDDDDVMAISPSKARQKQLTPKKGGKRKRSVDRSPAKPGALAFADPVGSPAVSFNREDSERTTVTAADTDTGIQQSDSHYELLQQLLNHRSLPFSEDRFVESMSSFALPSQPLVKLSSSILSSLQSLPQLDSLQIDLLTILAKTWKQCLDESYYAPINIFVETILFLLVTHRLFVAARMRVVLLPLIMQTVDLIAIPTGLAGKNSTGLPRDVDRIEKQMDTQQCLDLLSYIALGCSKTNASPASQSRPANSGAVPMDQESAAEALAPIQGFWQAVQFDFILVLLMRAQPKRAMRTVLSLLRSSCLANTFGTISVERNGEIDQEKQGKREDDLLHRMLDLLVETPKPLVGREEQTWDQADLALLRLDVLAIFQSMCAVQPFARGVPSHGSRLLAQHPRAIGKMFRFLSDSINLLYTYPPPPLRHFVNQRDNEPSPHALTAKAVNITMKILHHLITSFDKEIDVRQKLAAVPGGHHRHLVSLSRLAFSDQIFLDAGIEDGTVDAAHEMLDNYLTFEEGESLVMLFGTPTTKTASATNESHENQANNRFDQDEEMEAVNDEDEL